MFGPLGHQGQKTAFSAITAACMRFMFSKTSLALIVKEFLATNFVVMITF